MSRQSKGCATGLLVGLVFGAALGAAGHLSPPPDRTPEPYLAPQLPEGTALRMAMVHDVLHERFNRHGPAWFEARNRRTRDALDEIERSDDTGSPRHLELLDDLAVGLERVGKVADAIELMRGKLELQRETEASWEQWFASDPEPTERGPLEEADLALYRTYANLGTFLIHDAFPKAIAGDRGARDGMREGLEALRKAVAINPRAHFGRENWQIVAAEFLLAAFDRPELLLEYDLVGHRLDAPLPKSAAAHRAGWGGFWKSLPPADRSMKRISQSEPFPERDRLRRQIRTGWVTHTGAEPGWTEAVGGTHRVPVPFDEPVLGILGMWTLGGGANPHFALALAGTMERIGEWELAWKAYQRASDLSDRFWPRDDIREGLVALCRTRQKQLVERIALEEPSGTGAEAADRLRQEFHRSLDRGEQFQKALAAFESEQIAAGHPLHDRHFYRPFSEEHGQIASPVGDEDFVALEHRRGLQSAVPAAMLYGGLGSVLGLALARKRPKPGNAGR